jgi:hypothetical protein
VAASILAEPAELSKSPAEMLPPWHVEADVSASSLTQPVMQLIGESLSAAAAEMIEARTAARARAAPRAGAGRSASGKVLDEAPL